MTPGDVVVAATPLLATKLHAPRRRRGAVSRPRLGRQVDIDRQPVLTLVSAPAGFGKTTLLAEWFGDTDGRGRSAAWLALDAHDNDPAVFGSYVIAALQSVAPQVGASAAALLRSSQPLLAVAATLVNDLEALDRDIVLVIDDYHVIDSVDVHDSIAFLLDHAPPRFRLVVASRADPPLSLARLRACGDLHEVRAADLRFRENEAAAYFNGTMGLDLAAGEVGALAARTEGWIAALQLAALSMQGRDDVAGFIENFTGDDRFVVDYLVEEVLERQPDAVRRFLLNTAVLDRLTGPLCDAVTGETGGRATLEWLDRANLFLVPLDDRRHWYRYHHLFADVLRARLLDEHPEQVPGLHLRASTWFDAHGDQPEAIAHALAGHHVDCAARLIELATPMMRRTRQEATLRRWLEALPHQIFDARPVLTLTFVGARLATGDPTGAAALLDRAARWQGASGAGQGRGPATPEPIVFDQEEFARLPAQVAVYRAGLALLAGDLTGTVDHATRALALADPSDHFRGGAAAALRGLAHWSVGELDEARSRYADSVAAFVEGRYIPDVLGCSLALADIQIAQGRLRDARRTYESALKHTAGTALRGTADMHVGLSELRLEWNELDAAARHLETSNELGAHAGLPQHAYRWRVATARLRHARGDPGGALALLAEADDVYNTDFSPAVRPIAALRARMHLAQGDVASAVRWAADRDLTIDDELAYVREYEHISLARTLLAASRDRTRTSVADAIRLLQRLVIAAEHGHREGSVIEILALLAVGYDARNDRAAAVAALEQALVRAEPEGYARVFVEAGAALPALMRSASLGADATRYARHVLAGAGTGGPATPPRTGLVDELSSRELDVLRLLRGDLSGPEIARELHVSLNTVRTHTKNIYTKLRVTNRREAVRRAADLALSPDHHRQITT